MKPAMVIYATREGHTRRIVDHMAESIRARGIPADVVDAAHILSEFLLAGYPPRSSLHPSIVEATNQR